MLNFVPFKSRRVKDRIIRFIDYFYPLFKRFMPLQTYRYAVCGGSNTLLDIFIYYISYNFILKKEILDLGFYAIKPHVAAIFIAFLVSFPTGFFLNRYIVFPGSELKGRVQLFRYLMLVVVCILLNYVFIKLFVEVCGFYPTISKILTTVIVVSFSYVTQKKFTFKQSV